MTQTLAAEAHFELEVRRSRFAAHGAPVASPSDAMDFLVRATAADATHTCWAYRIGSLYRFNDDGEPSGTAGRPILAAIDGQQLDHTMVVVTRWFGGIKLGAGGLVRAYGGSAAECLRRAPRRPLVQWSECTLRCAFTQLGAVHQLLQTHAADKLDERFDSDGVSLRLRLPVERVEALYSALRDATRGQASLQPTHGES